MNLLLCKLARLFKKEEWEYGFFREGLPARRHKKNGSVQFILWKAGEQGHKEDFWHVSDSSWWRTFRKAEVSHEQR